MPKSTTKTCLVFTNQKKFSYENFLNLDSINFEYQSKLNFTELCRTLKQQRLSSVYGANGVKHCSSPRSHDKVYLQKRQQERMGKGQA